MLYFRDNVLENAEEVRARDILEAIKKSSGKPASVRVEIWRSNRRVAEIGISPIH